jgi:DNA-binding NarL/FixJ family response regulator
MNCNHTGTDMKIFVVEDSAAVRERLVEMIGEVAEAKVVGEAETFGNAVAGILETRPDVAILDIRLADDSGSGIDVLYEIRKTIPAVRAIVMSNFATPQFAKASADAGAEYFLDKTQDFERIPEILRLMASAKDGKKQ